MADSPIKHVVLVDYDTDPLALLRATGFQIHLPGIHQREIFAGIKPVSKGKVRTSVFTFHPRVLIHTAPERTVQLGSSDHELGLEYKDRRLVHDFHAQVALNTAKSALRLKYPNNGVHWEYEYERESDKGPVLERAWAFCIFGSMQGQAIVKIDTHNNTLWTPDWWLVGTEIKTKK